MTQSNPTENVEPMEKLLYKLGERLARDLCDHPNDCEKLILTALRQAASWARAEQIERDAKIAGNFGSEAFGSIQNQLDKIKAGEHVEGIAAAILAQLKEQRE